MYASYARVMVSKTASVHVSVIVANSGTVATMRPRANAASVVVNMYDSSTYAARLHVYNATMIFATMATTADSTADSRLYMDPVRLSASTPA